MFLERCHNLKIPLQCVPTSISNFKKLKTFFLKKKKKNVLKCVERFKIDYMKLG